MTRTEKIVLSVLMHQGAVNFHVLNDYTEEGAFRDGFIASTIEDLKRIGSIVDSYRSLSDEELDERSTVTRKAFFIEFTKFLRHSTGQSEKA